MVATSMYIYYSAGYNGGYNDGYITADKKLMNLHEYYNKLSENTSCGNISKYISGEGFVQDVFELKYKAESCYQSENGTTTQLYNVDYLENCSEYPIDCEDISFMVDCLAREYDIECEYYTSLTVGSSGNHRGIECNARGEFKKFN